MSAPVPLNFAPTGVVPTRATSAHVPISPAEIIADVKNAWALGITLVHLHARDKHGHPTTDPEVFRRIISGIREFAPDLVICISLSGRRGESLDQRMALLEIEGPEKPDMASLTLSSLNFAREASINSPETVGRLAKGMLDAGILPELEAFDSGMLNVARYLERKELIKAPHYANIILGNLAGAQPEPLALGAMLHTLPGDCLWALGGIGSHQFTAHLLAAATGGGIRTGLEDNLHLDGEKSRQASNMDLLAHAHQALALAGTPVMTSAQFRERLNLLPGNGAYGRALPAS